MVLVDWIIFFVLNKVYNFMNIDCGFGVKSNIFFYFVLVYNK